MNKKFFKDEITIYHIDENDNTTIMHFDNKEYPKVYFRHNKKSNLIDKRN